MSRAAHTYVEMDSFEQIFYHRQIKHWYSTESHNSCHHEWAYIAQSHSPLPVVLILCREPEKFAFNTPIIQLYIQIIIATDTFIAAWNLGLFLYVQVDCLFVLNKTVQQRALFHCWTVDFIRERQRNYCYHYYYRLTAFFQDNLDEPVPER